MAPHRYLILLYLKSGIMIKPNIHVERLEAYAITPQDVWSDMAPTDLLKIDWNETPSELHFYQKELVRIAKKPGLIAWYPDCLALHLTDEISKFVNVNSNFILTFPGSDVGLETLCRAYLNSGDCVVALCPTYENFFVYVHQMGADLHKLVLDEPFKPDFALISRKLETLDTVKMFYLANPNNPCGYSVAPEVIEQLAIQFPDTIFVVDEAYIEFTDTLSLAPLVEKHPNIIVFRTFSKAFGMAGLRLGYMCAPIAINNTVNKIRNGKNITMISQKLGIFALQNFDLVSNWINEVIRSRVMFERWCVENGVIFFPSEGNFVLFKAGSPGELCSALKAEGIYVRNRDSLVSGCVRVTMGSRSETSQLNGALQKFYRFLVF